MADQGDIDSILSQYGPEPQPLGGAPQLPNVLPREMRTPQLGQGNLVDRALSSFGQPSLDALRQGYAGEATPQEIARTFLETGPMGPFGMARAPARVPNPIRAYHGSPHDFDEFDLAHIGRGEGAQAYGHGMYFAENEGVARSYREALSQPQLRMPDYTAQVFLQRHGGNQQAAVAELDGLIARNDHSVDSWRKVKQSIEGGGHNPGRMYEVNLHARPEQFLDLNRSMHQQDEPIRRGLANLGLDVSFETPSRTTAREYLAAANGDWGTAMERAQREARSTRSGLLRQGDETAHRDANHVIEELRNAHAWPSLAQPLSHRTAVVQGGAEAAQALREAGIPGIRYLDQGSRTTGQGTSNYVVFNPEIIEILRKYGIAAPVAGVTTADILSQYDPDQDR